MRLQSKQIQDVDTQLHLAASASPCWFAPAHVVLVAFAGCLVGCLDRKYGTLWFDRELLR